MRITALISIAIATAMALSILFGQAATADPETRGHRSEKHLEKQKDRVEDRRANPAATHKPKDPVVNARQEHQKDRIVQGVKSGELTRKETKELVEERRDIKQLEQTYKADGTLTTQERKDLHQQLDQAGEEIREEKHDQQQR